MIALATYLVLQLAVFALNLYSDEGVWWSSISALVAFFFGGLVTSATALWHGAGQGAVNGAVMWALATIGLLLLAVPRGRDAGRSCLDRGGRPGCHPGPEPAEPAGRTGEPGAAGSP